MKSVYNFVVTPVGERYNNKKKVGDKELIINTEIFNHEYVNRTAIVKACPIINETCVEPGDEVIVHHNVFRRWHDVKGNERNSKAWFDEDNYIISQDQIFLRKIKTPWTRFKEPIWKPLKGFCFVKPLKSKNSWGDDIEDPTRGIIKYTDGSFLEGDVVGFTPFSKYEFIIEGEKLYRVYSKFITIKYEHKGNEETYNPSWAKSS
jgi:hypothetical protein|tara:strand:+ start:38 stop:652 length:615 start_codon:yes stop_codon:yes gene_type:complete